MLIKENIKEVKIVTLNNEYTFYDVLELRINGRYLIVSITINKDYQEIYFDTDKIESYRMRCNNNE